MIENIGLLTDNFYKFLTSLSLIAFIYCFSFDTLFLAPHNKMMTENNLKTAKLSSQYGYLKGVSSDLTMFIKDSIKKNNYKYAYNLPNDTSKFTYYSSILLHDQTKLLVDSLNTINQKLSECSFELKVYNHTIKTHQKNLKIKKWILTFGGSISFLIFLFGLSKWYHYRKLIDKK